MKLLFMGNVNTADLRLFFHKVVSSTIENETEEELETRFDSILIEWVMELTANENSS